MPVMRSTCLMLLTYRSFFPLPSEFLQTKPMPLGWVPSRQRNLRLKGKYSGVQQQKDKVEEKKVKGNDELLMERIMKVVNEHLSDSDFNVDVLTHEVGISRAQLHRKMKEMTGLPVSEFIRNIRLEQAVRLLKEQKINVTQVAYTVGFSNLAHFSTVFRKQFGISPTEYIEQNLQVETKTQ